MVAQTSRTGQGLYDVSKGISATLAERKASPLSELTSVLVRLDYVASRIVNMDRGGMRLHLTHHSGVG